MTSFAMKLDGRAIALDRAGPTERYYGFIRDRARGWLENGIPDATPADFGNWFFGTVIEGAVAAIAAAHSPDDRPRLEWAASPDGLDPYRFTIRADAPRLLWRPDRNKVILP